MLLTRHKVLRQLGWPQFRPTDTPKPVPTPTIECPTPTERAYINSVVEVFTPMGTAYGEFGRLNIEASDNPVLIFDDSWKLEVVLQLAVIEIAAEEITELTPPPSSSLASMTTRAT